jgi:hypothetical protein
VTESRIPLRDPARDDSVDPFGKILNGMNLNSQSAENQLKRF